MPSNPCGRTSRNLPRRIANVLVMVWQTLRAFFKWTSLATESKLGRCATVTQDFKFIACSRAACLAFIFLLCFLGLTYHVYKLQVLDHEHYNNAALQSTRKTITSAGERGKIYDYEGTILVGNLTGQRICAEPKRLKPHELEPVTRLLATDLNLDQNKLLATFNRIRNAAVDVTIPCDLTADNATVIANWNLTPVTVVSDQNDPETFQLKIAPKACSKEELDNILAQLSPIIDIPVKQLRERIDRAINRPVEIQIANNVDYNQAQKLKQNLETLENRLAQEAHVKRRKLFIRISPKDTRCYPQGELLANVLGFLNDRERGASGIELLFDREMTPTNGKITFQKDSAGRKLGIKDFVTTPPQNGANIFLTIRAPIQKIAEEELAKMVDQYAPQRAYAIMMNPRTGAIMALAQYPTFNPNNRENTPAQNMQNHCLTEVFEPGSVMKTVPISYAIHKGKVNLDTQFFCENGRWYTEGRILRDTHHNRLLTVSDILVVSSNIGTAKIAITMTAPLLYDALKKFGFGTKTNLGFIPEGKAPKSMYPESSGRLRALERWDRLSITRFPIGQGISCTPLQLLQAYGAIANNGTMMTPYLVHKIVYPNKTLVSKPVVKGHPISPMAAREITKALVDVVHTQHGTGKKARVPNFLTAGKTGSAQIWMGTHYAEKNFNASFIGFVPAHNPELVLLVTARGVKKHGGTVAGPVFSNIAARTLDFLDVKPEILPAIPEATTQIQP